MSASKDYYELKKRMDEHGPYGKPLEGESSLAFGYFCRYCDLGVNRSLSKLAEIEVEGKKRAVATLGEWSSKFDWQERVQFFDRFLAVQGYLAIFDYDELKARYVALVETQINVQMELLDKLHYAGVLYLDSVITELKAGNTSAGGQWIFRAVPLIKDVLSQGFQIQNIEREVFWREGERLPFEVAKMSYPERMEYEEKQAQLEKKREQEQKEAKREERRKQKEDELRQKWEQEQAEGE